MCQKIAILIFVFMISTREILCGGGSSFYSSDFVQKIQNVDEIFKKSDGKHVTLNIDEIKSNLISLISSANIRSLKIEKLKHDILDLGELADLETVYKQILDQLFDEKINFRNKRPRLENQSSKHNHEDSHDD